MMQEAPLIYEWGLCVPAASSRAASRDLETAEDLLPPLSRLDAGFGKHVEELHLCLRRKGLEVGAHGGIDLGGARVHGRGDLPHLVDGVAARHAHCEVAPEVGHLVLLHEPLGLVVGHHRSASVSCAVSAMLIAFEC